MNYTHDRVFCAPPQLLREFITHACQLLQTRKSVMLRKSGSSAGGSGGPPPGKF